MMALRVLPFPKTTAALKNGKALTIVPAAPAIPVNLRSLPLKLIHSLQTPGPALSWSPVLDAITAWPILPCPLPALTFRTRSQESMLLLLFVSEAAPLAISMLSQIPLMLQSVSGFQ